MRYKSGNFGNFGNRYEVTVPFLDGTHKHILLKNTAFLYSMTTFSTNRYCVLYTFMQASSHNDAATESSRSPACSSQRLAICK